MKDINCHKSLHLLKSEFQKTFMGKQCNQLCASLDSAIAATRKCAPVRTRQSYFASRPEKRAPADEEGRWEQAMWLQWNNNSHPIPDAWDRILHYQMMLRDSNKDEKWGEVDLLGYFTTGAPSVIELKIQDNITPAAMLVQGVAYAIAIQEAWDARFKDDWARFLEDCGINCELPKKLDPCRVVCAAPRKYWKQWVTWIAEAPKAKRVSDQTWDAFHALREGFKRRGFCSTFLLLDHGGDANGLPTTITVGDPFTLPDGKHDTEV